MRAPALALVWIVAATVSTVASADAACGPATGIGLSRIVEIDTRGGPLFGYHTGYQRAETFLQPKEVVLTFDDGPMPWITKSILDTLDNHCTKATFFSVGRMAIAYPQTTREILLRGHTLGTHTWSHPLNLKRLKPEAAIDEIERGFAAVAMAAGQPIAPFFRFPGLNDNAALLTHLQSRGVGTFTVDAISNDSYIHDAMQLIAHTMAQVDSRQGGIVLFHDIKAATARALPVILSELKAKGYKVVHMRSAAAFQPQPQFETALAPLLAKSLPTGKGNLVPFYGATLRPSVDGAASEPLITAIAPEPKVFLARANETAAGKPALKKPRVRLTSPELATSSQTGRVGQAGKTVAASGQAALPKVAGLTSQPLPARLQQRPARPTSPPPTSWITSFSSGWVTTVAPPRLRRSAVD